MSVYNQLEFEAGVLKQIDSEVQRRNAEQDRKFLINNHSSIKGEIKLVSLTSSGGYRSCWIINNVSASCLPFWP